MFDDETALIPSLKGSEVAEVVSKVNEGEEEAIAEALAALEAGTPEDEKDRVSKVTSVPSRLLITYVFTSRPFFRDTSKGL